MAHCWLWTKHKAPRAFSSGSSSPWGRGPNWRPQLRSTGPLPSARSWSSQLCCDPFSLEFQFPRNHDDIFEIYYHDIFEIYHDDRSQKHLGNRSPKYLKTDLRTVLQNQFFCPSWFHYRDFLGFFRSLSQAEEWTPGESGFKIMQLQCNYCNVWNITWGGGSFSLR